MSAPDANGWMPIREAPAGRCLMWVEGEGIRLGIVRVYPDDRLYQPDGFNGDWKVTHYQPLPSPPVRQ